MIQPEFSDFNSINDILMVLEDPAKMGPQLPIPIETLNTTNSFTLEMWFALEETTATNITLIGMKGRPWYSGFGIAGVINSKTLSLACVLDTYEIQCSSSSCPCSNDLRFCKTLPSTTHVWNHFACSRRGINQAQIMLNSDVTTITGPSVFNLSVADLFSPGTLVLGARVPDSTKPESFVGYVRELRIWNQWINKNDIIVLMNR